MKKLNYLFIIAAILSIAACKQQADSTNVANNNDVQYIHVGPNWDALQKLDTSSSKFSITSKIKKSYQLGDQITASVKSDRSGKLWVVFVDPNDEVTLMFPNAKSPDNEIGAGKTIKLPEPDSGWAIQAGEPIGQTIVSFIVTTGDVDLFDVLNSSTESTMNEALTLVDTSDQWSIETHVVTVEK
ncbi:MAG: DUF4384 domain-containing protein [Marinicella sp.]